MTTFHVARCSDEKFLLFVCTRALAKPSAEGVFPKAWQPFSEGWDEVFLLTFCLASFARVDCSSLCCFSSSFPVTVYLIKAGGQMIKNSVAMWFSHISFLLHFSCFGGVAIFAKPATLAARTGLGPLDSRVLRCFCIRRHKQQLSSRLRVMRSKPGFSAHLKMPCIFEHVRKRDYHLLGVSA